MAKTILVVGGAGYIGSHTYVELLEAGYDAVIVDDFSNAEEKVVDRLTELTGHPVRLYKGDATDSDFMRAVFESEPGLTGAIHFAACKAVGESVREPLRYYRNNLQSILVLLQTMADFDVADLVFSSSCTVYGVPDDLPVTEMSPRKEAFSPYGNTKKICEDIIRDTVAGGGRLKAVLLRYFNPIGAHPSALIGELPLGVPNNLVPFVTQTAAGIRPELTIFGDDYDTFDGTCIRDYIHVVDLACAHVKCLDYLDAVDDQGCCEAINVGTGRGNSVMEVVQTFEQVTGVDLNYKIGPQRPGDVPAIYANADKARHVLGWEAQLTLEDALRDAWRWQGMLTTKAQE